MSLEPVAPGLWSNPQWQPGTPGTFVLLIGISAYPYLRGGTGRPLADPDYGLGQLAVSALTAYEVFRWFRDSYRFTPDGASECPLAQCWLLLSPTEEEKRKEPAITDNLLEPTFDNGKLAVNDWYQAMEGLPRSVAAESRAFFLFSGHGLEIYQDEQIVLPSDYLRRRNLLNDAWNLRKLAKGLTLLPVPEQFFFVDACRNDHQDLRDRDIRGDGVIPSADSYRTNPACNGPILYASAAGTQSYQLPDPNVPVDPDDPNDRGGLSLFGASLLDGLRGRHGFQPDCGAPPCAVKLSPLHEFLGTRYNELLRKHKSEIIQYIVQGGQCSRPSTVLTHIAQRPSPAPLRESIAALNARAFTMSVDLRAASALPLVDTPWTFDSPTTPTGEAIAPHDAFGRETVTAMWENARVYSLTSRSWLPPHSLAFDLIQRTENSRGYRVTCYLPDAPGHHCLCLDDGTAEWTVLLSGERGMQPRYLVELTLADSDRGSSAGIARLTAGLAPDNPDTLRAAAQMWEKYQTVSPASAAEEIDRSGDMRRLWQQILDKMDSPLAATVATLVLLRAGQLRRLRHTWYDALLFDDRLADRSDPLILRNEIELAQVTAGAFPPKIARRLLEMDRRGLPHTGETLGYATRQVEDALEFGELNAAEGEALHRVQERLRRALRFFRPGGLFTVFRRQGEPVEIDLIAGEN